MIFVVGTGRCGTSTVAKVLERLGVDMGGPGRVCSATPDGDYEDQTFKDLNWAMVRGEITREQWEQQVGAYAATKQEPWGLKHPLTAEFLTLCGRVLPITMVIWCVRDLEDTKASWKRNFEGPDDFCDIWVPMRYWNIAAWLWNKPHVRIDMTQRTLEASIEQALGGVLPGVGTWASTKA